MQVESNAHGDDRVHLIEELLLELVGAVVEHLENFTSKCPVGVVLDSLPNPLLCVVIEISSEQKMDIPVP